MAGKENYVPVQLTAQERLRELDDQLDALLAERAELRKAVGYAADPIDKVALVNPATEYAACDVLAQVLADGSELIEVVNAELPF